MSSSNTQPPHNGVKTLTSRPATPQNTINGLPLPSNALQQPAPAKHLGTTPAVSLAGPRPEDLQRSHELRLALEPHNVFESEAELKHRMEIIAKLNYLVKQWIKTISIAKNMPEASAQKLGGKVYTFGSYRLGVHHKGADIDALCVAPRNIERSDFFTSFYALLKMRPEVTECRAIEEAFVPVIKMKFDGIEIDLLFARLSLKEIPDDFDLSDDNILKNLDAQSVRSLNGCRVTDEILALVPNVDNFSLALRTIKLWAKKHGIYSNALGYFGGVTWAMLMAKTCQFYPNATASTLVHKFFLVLSTWKWPIPVLLKQADVVNSRFPVWDPRVNVSDRFHLMPVITPAYPQQNSTYNVSESTKKIIVMEINRGKNTMDEIMLDGASWDRLFQAQSFFFRYRHFIVLVVQSQTADDHLEWSGLVESKIRLLIGNIERNQHISLAHIHPKSFNPKKNTNNISCSPQSSSSSSNEEDNPQLFESPFCTMWFIGLEFERSENLNVDLTEGILNFTEHVMHLANKTNMLKPDMSLEARHVKRKQLSQYLDADFLQRERQSMECQNSSTNTITAKRKRLSGEMLQADSNSNDIAKRTRLSESSEDSSNGSTSDASSTTKSDTSSSTTKSTATTTVRRGSSKFNDAIKKPAKPSAAALASASAALASASAALASSKASASAASTAATTSVIHPPFNELMTPGATATSTITYKSLSELYLKRSLSSTSFSDLTT